MSIANSLPPDFPVGITLSKTMGGRFFGINLIKLSSVFPKPILGLLMALVMEKNLSIILVLIAHLPIQSLYEYHRVEQRCP